MYIHVLGTYRCAVAVKQLVTVKWRLVTFLKQEDGRRQDNKITRIRDGETLGSKLGNGEPYQEIWKI